MSTLPAISDARPFRSLGIDAVLGKMFSFPVLLVAFLLFVGCIWSGNGVVDPDAWWHAKVGEQILRTHSWPSSDPYSFTAAGAPWMAYEWLGEVVIGMAALWGGLYGEMVLLAILSCSVVLLLFCFTYVRCRNSKVAFASCAVVLAAVAPFLTLRPQLLGYDFLLLTLICLELFRQGRTRAIWFLPATFLLWVNTHGTFVLGLGVVAIYWACGLVSFRAGGLFAESWTDKQRRQLLVVGLLCFLVLPLTPYGGRLAAYPLELSLSQPVNVASIQEWQPLGFNNFLGKYLLGVLLASLLALVVVRPKLRLEQMALLLLTIFAACVHIRFTLFFVFVFTPILATMLSRWVPAYDLAKDHWPINAVLIVGLFLWGIHVFPSRADLQKMESEKYPKRALAYLQQHPISGHMLNEYGFGGYMVWSAGPQRKVFIDGRADIYEYSGVLSDYLQLTWVEPRALSVLQKYDIQACLIKSDAPLATVLSALPEWQIAYKDELSTLFVRKKEQLGAAYPNLKEGLTPSAATQPSNRTPRHFELNQPEQVDECETVPRLNELASRH
jgi:hypothetical protein